MTDHVLEVHNRRLWPITFVKFKVFLVRVHFSWPKWLARIKFKFPAHPTNNYDKISANFGIKCDSPITNMRPHVIFYWVKSKLLVFVLALFASCRRCSQIFLHEFWKSNLTGHGCGHIFVTGQIFWTTWPVMTMTIRNSGIKPFKCNMCDYASATKDDLTLHKNISMRKKMLV